MTPKLTPRGSGSKGKLEAASATKTRAQLTAKTTGSIFHDAETYVLVNSEVEQNDSLATESLLQSASKTTDSICHGVGRGKEGELDRNLARVHEKTGARKRSRFYGMKSARPPCRRREMGGRL
jgi:hypothetical protein